MLSKFQQVIFEKHFSTPPDALSPSQAAFSLLLSPNDPSFSSFQSQKLSLFFSF